MSAEGPSQTRLQSLLIPKEKLGQLSDGEVWWRDHQIWLAEQGYMLRPRYRPGWKSSWKDHPNKWPENFEDWWYHLVRPKLCSVHYT